MKKIVIFFVLIISLFQICGCSESHILNIDTFIEKFNMNSDIKLERAGFETYEEKNTLNSIYMFEGGILLKIKRDKHSLNIISVSVTSSVFTEQNEKIITSILQSLEAADEMTFVDAQKLFNMKEKEYANEMRTQKYITLYFTKTKAGSEFIISFNEEDKPCETVIPETDNDFSFKRVTS